MVMLLMLVKWLGQALFLRSGELILTNYGFDLRKMSVGGKAPQGKGRRTEEKEKV